MEQLLRLKSIWERSKIRAEWTASEEDILRFEVSRGVVFPQDFRDYFKLVNGMDGEVDDNFYTFYSLNKIEDAVTQLKDYGIPRHGETIAALEKPENYFVFADYSINLIAYAIRLANGTNKNIIYAICGDAHKVLAESFSDFIKIYLNNSDDLLI